ncbi:MAG: hypothetical protein LGR52_09945 [Candidatus Thiosymbion ectosymbiont of Robbea hypermnestra]|nr:hypothetical protein [Candidatus Thiosymbion ectosymbiont of Robbea hypermnestra]
MKVKAGQLPTDVLKFIEDPDPLQGEDIIIEKDNGEIVGVIIQPEAYRYFIAKAEEQEDQIDAALNEKYTPQSKTLDDFSSSEIDPSILPVDVQNELYDFYEFLVKKHDLNKHRKGIDIEDIIPRKVNAFEPLRRESIYDR